MMRCSSQFNPLISLLYEYCITMNGATSSCVDVRWQLLYSYEYGEGSLCDGTNSFSRGAE